MGYRTYFNLSVDKTPEVIEIFRSQNEDAEYAIDEEGNAREEVSWYDFDKDMKAFSTQFPDVLFTMQGEGDDKEDLWINYYKNGKVQECPAKIEYDDFDESKLK